MTYREGTTYSIRLKKGNNEIVSFTLKESMCQKQFNRMLMFKYNININDVLVIIK